LPLILAISIEIILGFSKRINSNLILIVLMNLFASATANIGFTHVKLYEIDQSPYLANKSTKAFQRACHLARGNKKLEIAIVLVHAASFYGEPQDQPLLDAINMAVRNSRISTGEVLALKRFVNCKIKAICDTEHITYKNIFTNLLSNPRLKDKLHDDVQYIYSSYLVTVPGEEEQALEFIREIVARNPENLTYMTYKIRLISVLLTNEYMTAVY
jgi:hypothetical protein